mgnify:CR=1 FL=1
MLRVSRGVVQVKGRYLVGDTKTDAAVRRVHIGDPKTEAGIGTVRIPASMRRDVKTQLHEHAQLGQNGLLFWRDDGGHVTRYLVAGRLAPRPRGRRDRRIPIS